MACTSRSLPDGKFEGAGLVVTTACMLTAVTTVVGGSGDGNPIEYVYFCVIVPSSANAGTGVGMTAGVWDVVPTDEVQAAKAVASTPNTAGRKRIFTLPPQKSSRKLDC